MKDTWVPGWYLTGRKPAFVGDDKPLTTFGTKKYLWGNMPALDILKIKDNKGTEDVNRDLALLKAAPNALRQHAGCFDLSGTEPH